MKAIVARCGFRCDLCGAFVKNSSSVTDRVQVAAAWSKYYHVDIKPESIRCYGCLAAKGRGFDLPSTACAVRRCVIRRKLDTCADCADYPCTTLEKSIRGVEKVIKKFKGKIPKREFDRFIAPYDARTTLNRLRKA